MNRTTSLEHTLSLGTETEYPCPNCMNAITRHNEKATLILHPKTKFVVVYVQNFNYNGKKTS